MTKWAIIPGYDSHYRVSDCGQVQSCHAWGPGTRRGQRGEWKSLSTPPDKNGYQLVYLWDPTNKTNGRVRRLVHQLVAAAFIPKVDGKDCVNHKDGNKSNPHASNLEWCTHAENSRHALATGLLKFAKLTEDQVREIRSCGGTDTAAAKRFGISQVMATKIRARKAWKHVV